MNIFDDLIAGVTGLTSNLWPQPAEKPGLVAGKLRPCPGTPNCVSSECDSAGDLVKPLAYTGMPDVAWKTLKQLVSEMGGIVREDSGVYIWSTFLVPVAGFTDDVEFRLDAAEKVIHVRSASRLGYSDLGMNRSRVDQLRKAFSSKGL
jgi:uncharacterized protein (DUF1499 family)